MVAKVLLVDDHPIVREGLRALIESQSDLILVGEAGDGLLGLKLVERLQPDVLVLDLMLPGLDGLEITRQVRRQAAQTRIVILSMHANEAYAVEALRAGAIAYVVKKSAPRELLDAIRAALAGQRYLSPSLSEKILEDYERLSRSDMSDLYKTLTPRERQVLHLVTEGLTNNEIALRLEISPRTAEMHRANLMRKVGARSTPDLVRYALKRGIMPLE